MNLNDLYKLAGIQKNDAPAIKPVEVEQQVAEQPINGREDMKAMIALIDPEVLNKLGAEAPVEEEGYANSSDHYSGEPEEYKGTLGSPADLSLRRYLGANGMPVNVDETKVYEDHKVEDITEAWKSYKAEPVAEVKTELEEEPNEGNEFAHELKKARDAGKDEFEVDGKKYKVKENEMDLNRLKKLAGTQQVDEAPFPGEYDYSDDKYDADGAVTGVSKFAGKDVDLRFAKWSKDTPSQLMAVIKKHNITPDEAWQMGNRDNMADIDIVVDYHDKFTDRFDTSGMSDDEITDAIDIDGGTEWMDSPEHDALYRDIINPLCKAMGMEGGNVEECGQALMKYIDDTPPQESVNEGGMKQAEIEVQDWANKYNEYLGVNGDELANGYLQAMLNTGIMSDAFDQDEYIAFNEKNGYDDDGDWSEDDHDKFMQSSPITRGMFREIRAIEKKYGIDEQGVNDILGYFESVNRMKTLAGI